MILLTESHVYCVASYADVRAQQRREMELCEELPGHPTNDPNTPLLSRCNSDSSNNSSTHQPDSNGELSPFVF